MTGDLSSSKADPSPTLRTLLFNPSAFEDDDGFRDTLQRLTHQGLKWAGLAALVGEGCYILLSVLVLGRPAAMVPGPGLDASTILLLDDTFNAALGALCLMLVWQRCSLKTGRRFTAAALLLAGAVNLYDDVLYSTLQDPGFLTVIYMLWVVAVPFRPWQVLALGGGFGGLCCPQARWAWCRRAPPLSTPTCPCLGRSRRR
jgi:hypothetical protein